jgi:hypothetical protein
MLKNQRQKSVNEIILHFILLGLQQEENIELGELFNKDLHIKIAHKAASENIANVEEAHNQIMNGLKDQNLSIYACSLYPALAAYRIMLEIAKENDPSNRIVIQRFVAAIYGAADHALQEGKDVLAKELKDLACTFMPPATALTALMSEAE